MDGTPRNRLLAAETLGFFTEALQYDRVYFWCLVVDGFTPPFNPLINKLHEAAKDLADRLDGHTYQELRRILSTIQKEWNASFGSEEHRALVARYQILTKRPCPNLASPEGGGRFGGRGAS